MEEKIAYRYACVQFTIAIFAAAGREPVSETNSRFCCKTRRNVLIALVAHQLGSIGADKALSPYTVFENTVLRVFNSKT